MATYIATLRFTPQGLQSITDSPKRAAAFKAAAKKMGVKVTAEYWTLGSFDGLVIFESPDEETATALMLRLSGEGNVQTQTARAFGVAEVGKVLERLKG